MWWGSCMHRVLQQVSSAFASGYAKDLLSMIFVTLEILWGIQHLWRSERTWSTHFRLCFHLFFQPQDRLPCNSIRKQGKLCRACRGIAERCLQSAQHRGKWWGSSELLLVPVHTSALLLWVRIVWCWRDGTGEIPGGFAPCLELP